MSELRPAASSLGSAFKSIIRSREQLIMFGPPPPQGNNAIAHEPPLDDLTVVVMAGGRGTRLAPFTFVLPKPLVPLGEIPIVEIMISRLSAFGARRFLFSLGHMADILIAYLNSFSSRLPGLEIDYVIEDHALGTAGALRLIEDRLSDEFLVTNGDLLTDLDYADLLAHHRVSGAALTIASCEKTARLDFGVLVSDGDQRVADYIEKPSYSNRVSMGIYVFSRRAIRHIGADETLGFNELVLRLLQTGERVSAYPFAGKWMDIGRPEDYALAADAFAADPNRYLDR